MRRLRPLPLLFLLVLAFFAAIASALLPVPPPVPVNANLGANVHAPSRVTNPPAEWTAARELLSSLPAGTPVRDDLLWHEWAWVNGYEIPPDSLKAKLQVLAIPGGPILLSIVPLPWPGSWYWSTLPTWGYVDEREIPAIVAKTTRLVAVVREQAKALGINESRIVFQIGNEPGAGHPGGWAALPTGEWWDRHGRMCAAIFKAARFGRCKVAAPSLSFLEHANPTRQRELDSAAPILRTLAPYVDFAAVHSRTYAPGLSTRDYADRAIREMAERVEIASRLCGGKPAIVPEFYIFREDRGAVDDRAEVLRLMAPRLPARAWLYRVGPGPSDPTTAIPLATFKSARSGEPIVD